MAQKPIKKFKFAKIRVWNKHLLFDLPVTIVEASGKHNNDLFVVILRRSVPTEPLFIKPNHGLRALGIGISSRHQVRLVRPLPLDEEHQLARRVRGANDAFRFEATIKSLWAIFLGLFLLDAVSCCRG